MARNVGQIISRGDRRWPIWIYLGHDHRTKKTQILKIERFMIPRAEAQPYLMRKLREPDLGRDLEEVRR